MAFSYSSNMLYQPEVMFPNPESHQLSNVTDSYVTSAIGAQRNEVYKS